MELNVRTWNMNYWKKREGHSPKTVEEKIKWAGFAKESIIIDNDFDFLLLQETSLNMFSGENIEFCHIDDDNFIYAAYINNEIIKRVIYNSNPKKYLSWGNMIISKWDMKNDLSYPIQKKHFNNTLTYQCFTFIINKPITFINVHLQKDFKTKMYYPSLLKLIDEIKTLKNDSLIQQGPIILAGDFNASDKFSSVELDNFKKAFIAIKEMGFIDCTESIDLNKRSTMYYDFQNDYVFVNEPYYKNISDVKIRKDIVSEYIDHYPIDFKVEI